MRVLLVGDGNGSLATGVARILVQQEQEQQTVGELGKEEKGEHVVLCTTLENRADLQKAHPDALPVMAKNALTAALGSAARKRRRRETEKAEKAGNAGNATERMARAMGGGLFAHCGGVDATRDIVVAVMDSLEDDARACVAMKETTANSGESEKRKRGGGGGGVDSALARLLRADGPERVSAACRGGLQDGYLFDHAVFHFPHRGAEDQHAHRRLLAHAFASLAEASPTGLERISAADFSAARVAVARVVHVTLTRAKTARWDLAGAAECCGFLPVGATRWTDSLVPGYERRRNVRRRGFKKRVEQDRGADGGDDECITVSFALPSLSPSLDSPDQIKESWWLPPWFLQSEPVAVAVPNANVFVLEDGAVDPATLAGSIQDQGQTTAIRPSWAKPAVPVLFWPPWPRPPEFPPVVGLPEVEFKMGESEEAALRLECPTCGYYFQTHADLHEHIANVEVRRVGRLTCPGCRGTFQDERALAQHRESCS
jgi:hypothetical protein